jgi:RimJ/RimL family protein N-acetyltransferase
MESVEDLKNKKITEEKIVLRRIRKSDLAACVRWLSDSEVTKFLSDSVKNVTEEQELEWFNFIDSSVNDMVFALIARKDRAYIGNCGLHKIDWQQKTCEFGIFIGDKSYWNKNYGTFATKAIAGFVFKKLKFDKIRLLVYEYNHRAIKVYKSCGFVIEDILKKNHLYNNIYWDTYVMEYKSSDLKK